MKTFRALKRNIATLLMLSLLLFLLTVNPAQANSLTRKALQLARVPLRLVQISSALLFLGSTIFITKIDYYKLNDEANEAVKKFQAQEEAKQKAAPVAVPESEVERTS